MPVNAETQTAVSDPFRHLRLMTLKQVLEVVPYTAQHIYRLERAGRFPRRLKIGENRVAWRLTDIEAWMASRPHAVLPPDPEWD